MDRVTSPAFDGWLPVWVSRNEPEPFVEWCRLDKRRFMEPFFEQTIEQCLRHPFNLLFRRRTPLTELLRWQERQPGLTPTGFIFHMSRCGSTLLAQMLAAVPRNVVISEAPPIDSILQEVKAIGEEERVKLFRALLSALGQPRAGNEQKLFVKFDSWHIFHLPLIRRAFPQAPWIFLYRNPVEVMVSQMKQRGLHMTAGLIGLEPLGIGAAEAVQISPQEYRARVLSEICRAGLEHLRGDRLGRAVNYTELPEAAWLSLPQHFCLDFDEEEVDQMKSVTEFDAKTPAMYFCPDSADKRSTASPEILELSERWIEPAYTELEYLRLQQNQGCPVS